MRKPAPASVTDLGDGVFFVRASAVNWLVLVDGDSLTLVDTGYPGDADALDGSLAEITRRTGAGHLEAVLVTHAHSDHIGSLGRLHAGSGGRLDVFASAEEVPHVRREVLHQVSVKDLVRHAYDPRVLRWALHATGPERGLDDVAFGPVKPLVTGSALDVPGRPVALLAPGHTPGHTVYHLPQHGLLVTGDALVSGHATVRRTGPQTLPGFFNHDEERTRETADRLALFDADRFAPGHGPVAALPHRVLG
ncbi:putative metallo-hydrolase YflN [Frondihabitans sp. 762G35]|uniref:MBL fold metallo-hydrolase n=1 Tax=Frondihabitans sp. 762G35 TaxID=1446794 RepID=UPI000D2130BE|nr:MBL fold metallo-hydrolase [Frondihabitans sp. 762G35]ARC58416.1 putative metallo-hydrolase YflN [Frondihabitans sp. 762G35]